MALADAVTLPSFAPSAAADTRGVLWIASDEPPFQASSWPLLTPLPAGWHVVTQAEAEAIMAGRAPQLRFTLVGPGAPDPVAEAAALSSSPPEEERRRQSRRPREPRPPRAARRPRAPRTVRPARLFREPRVARRPRRPRKPRAARTPRKPRPPRPKYVKTTNRVGTCKGPSCTCWTPAGCIGSVWVEAVQLYPKACLRGPCWSYEACVTGKCAFHVGCTINTILQFWANQYHAAVAYVQPTVAPVLQAVRAALPRLTVSAAPAAEVPTAPELPPGAVTIGCRADEYWTLGLTGCRCVPAGTGLPAATQAQVIACIGQAAWDRLVAASGQGQTA